MDHTVSAISAFNDNYIWAISAKHCNAVVLVDPGCANTCINYIEKNKLSLTAIIITHHHYDHVDGINALIKHYPQQKINVYTPKHETVLGSTHGVDDGDLITIEALKLTLKVMAVPGHTLGHIAYYNNSLLFCGDTLFSGGCGRVFEGTTAQMYHSLSKLASLNNDLKMYCAHEYTLANLAFALTLEPNNEELHRYNEKVKTLRAKNLPSIPSTMAQEKAINPFLRCTNQTIRKNAEQYAQKTLSEPVDVFTVIRSWKNNF
jgi:hydroxyacylglutathione hydrolase